MDGQPSPGDEQAEVRAAALRLLARREHSRLELARKLRQRGRPEALVAQVLDELVEARLLSDARFAEQYVHSRAGRGYGPVRIRAELRERGVSEADIEAALEAAEADWGQLAEAARRKRFGQALPEDFPTRARQMRFLQNRGFDADQLACMFPP
ncbi:regulatory protein RecX [Thiohalobacter sp.]|uniref:regulatory protein RecX n=1 Tax=Thiohalobacter sp. TaxID=2025948 RepID=UPI00262D33D4|nr:regulatory protein RecX [Thiohalobacter sp.]